ncbi:MAG: hypothetical protein FWE22_00585 [Firmicutes bacterium]|nr:hypothetical protein [Bacillota bacterium]
MKKSILKVLLVAVLVFASAIPLLGCYGHDYEEGDFCLTIELESQVLVAEHPLRWIDGEVYYGALRPVITATLRNLSGHQTRIFWRGSWGVSDLFSLELPSAIRITLGGLPPPRLRNMRLEEDEYISRRTFSDFHGFLLGEHEATVTTSFYVNYRRRNRQLISLSQTISFTVIEQQ